MAYGYKVVFNENKVKVMVEDKEAADVVRWIFNEAEKGTLHSVIAAELNAKHILTPAQYKVRHNIEKLEKLRGVKWTVDTLSQILKNEVYIGRYVTGKDRVCLYRHEKRHTTNKDEWYVFENHHIALITKEQFYAVQKNKRKVIKPAKKQTVNMLKGKITCGCCGSSIHIHPEKYGKVYMCTHRKRYGKDSCNCLPVKVDDVYAAVLAVIKEQIQVFVDREMILKEHHNDSRVIRQEQVYTEAVNKCVKEMDRLMELKSGLYADYTEDLLDEKEYLHLGCLLEEMFPEAIMQMISSVISFKGSARKQQFTRLDEYILILVFGEATIQRLPLSDEWRMNPDDERATHLTWKYLIRSGSAGFRERSPGNFYPVFLPLKANTIALVNHCR